MNLTISQPIVEDILNFTANDGAAIVINYSGLYPVGNKGLWANGVNYYTSDYNTGIIYAIKK
ncbi:MAG TPA: hypothetical protein VN721_09605 [Flavipsychrobacter sp.]|nr:hypothetical protein [Flavipsychrobacter sp.]